VDSHPLPYAVNHTITYPSDDGRRMPSLVQRLRVDDVNVERSVSDSSIHYNLTSAVSQGEFVRSFFAGRGPAYAGDQH